MKSCPELRNLKPGNLLYFRISNPKSGTVSELRMVSDIERDANGDVNSVAYSSSAKISKIVYSPCFLAGMPENAEIVEKIQRNDSDLDVYFSELKVLTPQKTWEKPAKTRRAVSESTFTPSRGPVEPTIIVEDE